MRKQIDNILLSTLWLLAAMLGTSFWFSTIFRFNIFARSHWQYLGQLQASGVSVNPSVYISICVSMLITLIGLYILISPRLRKINFNKGKTKTPVIPALQTNQTSQEIQTTQMIQETQDLPGTNNYIETLVRPPRLNISAVPRSIPVGLLSTPEPLTESVFENQSDEIKQLFQSDEFSVKDINSMFVFPLSLFAISSNETVWIGAQNTDELKFEKAVQSLESLFLDTLPDIPININCFLLNPITSELSSVYKIERFDNLQDLGDYLSKNKPEEITSENSDDFQAYSEYIDTLIEYIKKLNN